MEKLACVNDYASARALNEFAAPGLQLVNQQMLTGPAMNSAYHDKSVCLSVIRVHGWSLPANNALRFEAVYKADDSGQTVKVEHEAVRQPDGAWLFTKQDASASAVPPRRELPPDQNAMHGGPMRAV